MGRAFAVAIFIAIAGCATDRPATTVAPAPQIAHLNHFFATVDAETAAAIEASPFLRRFANLEVRTTTGTDASWTGRYLYGRQTYAEFFGPGDFQIAGKPAPPGSWGIAVSGDRCGDSALLRQRIEALGHKAVVAVDTRRFGDRTVPWFTAVTALGPHGDSGGLDMPVTAWAMEYVESYFDLPEAAKEAAEGPDDVVSRERYQSDLYSQRMMRDVTHVAFDVSAADYARIEPMLRAAGYRLVRTGDTISVDGDEADFTFNLSAAGRGLRRIDFVLNAPQQRHVERIGRSRLAVGPGATAVWTFD